MNFPIRDSNFLTKQALKGSIEAIYYVLDIATIPLNVIEIIVTEQEKILVGVIYLEIAQY